MVALLKRASFLTTIYGLYFSHHLHIFFTNYIYSWYIDLLWVAFHMRFKMFFPIFFPSPLYQGNALSLTNVVTYPPCKQKAVTCAHFSWGIRIKKPRSILLMTSIGPSQCATNWAIQAWIGIFFISTCRIWKIDHQLKVTSKKKILVHY